VNLFIIENTQIKLN